jgi:hypothetical protein
MDHPKVAGFLAAIALAIAFTPKASIVGSWVSLGLAMVFGIAMLFGIAERQRWGWVNKIASVCALLLIVAAFGIWLTDALWLRPIAPVVIPLPTVRVAIQETAQATWDQLRRDRGTESTNIPKNPTAAEIAEELTKMHAVKEEVPERWKIAGNRFSEWPSADLCAEARRLAQTMKDGKEEAGRKTIQDYRDHMAFMNDPNVDDYNKRIEDSKWPILKDLAWSDFRSAFVFKLGPNSILVLKALALRAPAGSIEPWKIDSLYAVNNLQVGLIDEMAKDLEQLANAIEQSKSGSE